MKDGHEAQAVGLSALGYYLPPTRLTVAELVEAGQATSDADKLVALGYGGVHVAGDEPVERMAARAIEDLVRRTGFDLGRAGMLLYGGGIATSSVVDPGPNFAWNGATNPLPLFKFPASRLQVELGLPKLPTMGVAQMACSAFQACVRVARGLLLAEPDLDHILCVAADRFPVGANREIVFNLMSDGACAGVVSRRPERNRILATAQATRGAYWDCERSHDQLVAAYFPLVRETIVTALARAGLGVADLDLLIPHNVNARSWDIMAQILGLPREKLFADNIARFGHAVASDNVINHVDAIEAGRLRPGAKVAWFVTGFGAHWNCTVLEA